MTRKRLLLPAMLCAGIALVSTARAQTATHTETISGGTGFSGTLGGDITIDVKSQNTAQTVLTQGMLNVTDLDIEVKNDGGFLNAFPNDTSNNNTASTPIDITPTTIGINIPTTSFSSSVSGTFDVTAGDNLANDVVGVLDGGVPGSDGKWDDPNGTGILNNATAQNFNVGVDDPISATASVTGSINAGIPSDVTIPDIVDTTIFNADLRVKSSSNVQVNFSPSQNVSLANLSIGATTPVDLNVPLAGNFTDGNHPVSGANGATLTLDLSAGGGDLVATTISGDLVADIMGTISGNIDIAADISIIGLINFTINQDNVVNGLLSDGTVSLLDLSENLSLPSVDLPFTIQVLHEANTNVDFDDVFAQLQSGTLGLTFPIALSEQDLVLDLPATSFELSELSTHVDAGLGQHGDVIIHHLAATLGGQLVLDVGADLELNANLLATAYDNSAINVVPEPGSVTLLAFAGVGLVGYCLRRRRRA